MTVLFFSLVAFSLLTPVNDPDLCWHLATGKWIAEHRALPDTDPFSFTTQTYAYEAYARTEEILKRYWLAQLLLYGSYVAGGYYGVIALRVLVFLGIFLLLFRWLREEGLDTPAALLFLAPLGFVLPPFVGDRPNQMTYLLALAALYLTDSVRTGKRRGWLLVPVMLLWSNMHGGFILGMALIGLFMVHETVRVLVKRWKGEPLPGYGRAMLIYALALAASGLNPVGFKAFSMLIGMDPAYRARDGGGTMTLDLDESVAQAMEADVRLLPLLPELLTDLWELGPSAEDVVAALESVGVEPESTVLDLA